MNRLLRTILATVAAVATVALLAGCDQLVGIRQPQAYPTPAASRTPDVSGAPAGFERFYAQELSWSSCDGLDPGSYDCTEVTAPLDWNDAEAGEISLAVIRRAADNAQPLGSLLTNPGGPGASGFDLIESSALYAVSDELARAYDVIGFDPRGVGRSTAVHCFDGHDMDAYLFDVPAAPRGSDAWKAELTERNTAFAQACEDGSDGILPYVTTDNAARDMDLLRGVLGDRTLNYLGYSYGTFLGASYAKLFPERVGHLVLDGAIDPSVSGLEVGTVQGVGFESALRAFMAHCLDGRSCPFDGTLDEAMSDLGALFAALDKTPLTASDGRQLGADSLLTGIVAALYSEDSWPFLTRALSGALEGDADGMLQLADFYYGRSAAGYEDNSTEAFRAYNCMDYPADTSEDDERAATERLRAEAPTIAPYWEGEDACLVWPYPPTGVRERIDADTDTPILVIGTTNDPATPYEWSVSLAEQLSSGVLITREGEGHTGYNKGNACVNDAVDDFFLSSEAPEDGLRC